MLQTYDAAILGCGEAGVFAGTGVFSTDTPPPGPSPSGSKTRADSL